MLEIDTLTIRYGKHLAVDGVSLSVARGETVVLLGANGAGKSSLLKAIAGLVKPASGDVRVDNNSLATIPGSDGRGKPSPWCQSLTCPRP